MLVNGKAIVFAGLSILTLVTSSADFSDVHTSNYFYQLANLQFVFEFMFGFNRKNTTLWFKVI